MDRWSRLSHATQFRIAVEFVRRRGDFLKGKYPNVLTVGAGYRSHRDAVLPVAEICLRFLVKRKWKKDHTRSDSIPRYVRAYAQLRGKRVLLAIPTDVTEFRGGTPHAGLDLTQGIMTRDDSNPVDYGSICCMVKNNETPAERYLLTCYHVFSPGLDDNPAGYLDCVTDEIVIGPMFKPAANPESSATAVDAALAAIEDGQINSTSTWGRSPIARATDFDMLSLTVQTQLFVYGRGVAPAVGGLQEETRTGPLPAVFQSLFPKPIPFDYRNTAGKTFYFADTLQYVANVRPGDSGAAVMNDEGKLFGMHFYGQGNLGFAFSAPRLFDPNVFPFDLMLA